MAKSVQAAREKYIAPKQNPPDSRTSCKGSSGSAQSSRFVPSGSSKKGGAPLIARHDSRRPSALHGTKPPAIKPPTVDDQLRKECGRKFDFENHGGLEGLKQTRPTLVRVTQRVAKVTQVPFPYLLASLYAESNFRTGAVNDDAKGIAQSKRIAWDELKKDTKNYNEFKTIWNQLSPGRKLPSEPMQSPTADILFMAVWTLKREKECPALASLKGQQKVKAQRLSYKLQAKANDYIGLLARNGSVSFENSKTNTNWQTFQIMLDTIAQSVAQSE